MIANQKSYHWKAPEKAQTNSAFTDPGNRSPRCRRDRLGGHRVQLGKTYSVTHGFRHQRNTHTEKQDEKENVDVASAALQHAHIRRDKSLMLPAQQDSVRTSLIKNVDIASAEKD